jgi:hypothetical protein
MTAGAEAIGYLLASDMIGGLSAHSARKQERGEKGD